MAELQPPPSAALFCIYQACTLTDSSVDHFLGLSALEQVVSALGEPCSDPDLLKNCLLVLIHISQGTPGQVQSLFYLPAFLPNLASCI